MKSRWLSNLLLLTLVLAAAGALFWPRALEKATGHPLSALTPQSVTQIRVEAAGRAPLTLEKRNDAWFMREPYAARADQHRVEGLLSLTQARSEKKFAATDLARFELDKPLARVTLNQQTFSFGGTHPINQQLYVQTGDAVYLVSAIYFADIAKRPEDFLSKQLLAEGAQPIGFSSDKVKWQRIDGQWQRTPAKPDITQNDANRYADTWRQALASEVSARTGTALGSIDLTLANGKQIRFDILQRTPELVLWRSDEKLAYRFGPETSKQLLQVIEQ
jgi:hypothetical protein